MISKFQLTLPVWGATLRVPSIVHAEVFQLTLPVWGATFALSNLRVEDAISTHAPRVGSDRRHQETEGE